MKKYKPSNGTEGLMFLDQHCCRCIHDNNADPHERKCDILTRTLLHDLSDPEYPKEWCYVGGKPTCTAWVKWDWSTDGDPDDPNNPKLIEHDPNQLSLFPNLLEA